MNAWEILGIEPTKDKKEIVTFNKTGYRHHCCRLY